MKCGRALLIILITFVTPCALFAQDTLYADHNLAIHRTMILEGGYVHTSRTRGGQIYRGITRVSHPKWEGWKIVDSHKLHYQDTLADLDELAEQFYKTRYWDYIRAGELTNQQTANRYFNSAVKLGLDRGIMKAQRSVGLPATGTVTDELIERLNARGLADVSSAKKGKGQHHAKKHHYPTKHHKASKKHK